MRALASIMVVLLALTGCRLVSEEPLLDTADAVSPYPGNLFLVRLTKDGAVALSESGAAETVIFRREGPLYISGEGEKRATLSFHALPGDDGLRLLQFTPSGERTLYGLARPEPERLPVRTIDLGDERREALRVLGHDLTEKRRDTVAGDREALEAAVAAYRKANARNLDRIERPDLDYAAAVTQAQADALLARLANARCLAFAGHPLEPEVAALDEDFRTGRRMEEIDLAEAEPACAQAMRHAPSRAVRYAQARVLSRQEDWAARDAILDALIEEGYGLAVVFVADSMRRGLGVKQDAAGARALLEEHATDRVEARHFLGVFRRYGLSGDDPDPAEAAALFDSAMKAGFAPARVEYAHMQGAGIGMEADPEGAYRNYRIAAEAGIGEGLLETGRALYLGKGVERDYEEAYDFLERATAYRLADAWYIAGFMKSKGQGTSKDPRKAAAYFEEAMAAGSLPAKGEYGNALYRGAGVAKDRERGLALLREAAEAGDGNSALYLKAIEEAGAEVDLSTFPREHRGDVRKLVDGKPFALTDENIPLMAGLASALMAECGSPRAGGQRAELLKFVTRASSGMIFGGDYSNRDIGKSVASLAKRTALQAAGEKAGRQVPCGAVSERIAGSLLEAIRSNARGADGGESRFVKTCQRRFSARQCQCLADTGRVAIPDIHRRSYDRRIVKEMIERNPMLGMMVGLTCGITNY